MAVIRNGGREEVCQVMAVVRLRQRIFFYGGNQEWWKGRSMSGYGCGTIAATDILLYLDLHKDYCKGKEFQEEEKGNGILDAEVYEKCVETMRKKYFPIC